MIPYFKKTVLVRDRFCVKVSHISKHLQKTECRVSFTYTISVSFTIAPFPLSVYPASCYLLCSGWWEILSSTHTGSLDSALFPGAWPLWKLTKAAIKPLFHPWKVEIWDFQPDGLKDPYTFNSSSNCQDNFRSETALEVRVWWSWVYAFIVSWHYVIDSHKNNKSL